VKIFPFFVVVSLLAIVALANAGSPYAGEETREIKTLSQEEVEGYLNGKGLGYAKAAELNQFPGPKHVLELGEELALTTEQTSLTQAVFDDMKAQAITFGIQLVDQERELNQQFASQSIDADSLETLLLDIGALQAKIRYVHLSAHLEQKAILTKHQILLYDQLRGYGTSHNGKHNQSH
jgi:Spy/CpxP family protein refolding chaperone